MNIFSLSDVPRRLAQAALTATILFPPSLAQAQGIQWRPGLAFGRAALQVCGSDIARQCSGTVPGGGRIAQCLMDARDKLSPDCRRFVREAMSAQTTLFACAADAHQHCGSTQPGGGRVVSCLNEKRAAISRDCARALDEAASLGR
jgi:hypothetical protein